MNQIISIMLSKRNITSCGVNDNLTFHRTRYELCAIHGLYVIDETNLETHGFDPTFQHNALNPACQPAWLGAIIDRGARMYERDKNFPAIIMWSLGNEAGYGPAHDALAAYLRAKDPTRPIHYEVR